MKTFKIGGVHPKDQKLSANKAIDTLALPKQAIIPLSQHIGAPATPVVAKGDYVRVGQLIAKATGFMSANIHSPYSGTIEKIDTDNPQQSNSDYYGGGENVGASKYPFYIVI